ncbi:flotillin family protein [Hugenholtzia roseola]|uniref:flotillin family protein n=1 Tax=Hugenholtzia roseola TaxID=1002 RepID=UPI000409975D|nr:flotillin family protein [Hugenholtzia roseola]
MEFLLSLGGISVVILFLVAAFLLSRYKRCPSNKILVIYGNVGKGKSAKCVHGGGSFVLPIIQDWQFLNLNPIPIEIDLRNALSKQNIRINTPSTFTVAISTREEIMLNAAERLLSLDEAEIRNQALDIIIGQLRLVIATLTIEEINQDREQFLSLINKHVASELNKIGLELINVNIKDITDESGYIEAIGKKAAAEAINIARIQVAEQERSGAIGETKAVREREVQVALEVAATDEGRKEAEAQRRIRVAELEAKAAIAETKAVQEKEVSIAAEEAKGQKGKKEADSTRRIEVAKLEADAVNGENLAKANVVDSNATLAEKSAEAKRRSDIANAVANKEILEAEKATELARLEKDEIVKKEIQKRKQEIEAEAEAERVRRIAKGEADATLLKYQAEAEGLKKLLEAKAKGYQDILASCEGDTSAAATLLLIEKLEMLVEKQTEAIANLKIDKITVWENGASGANGGATSNFVRNLINTLPPMHELAQQVGIELPRFLGNIQGRQSEGLGQEEDTAE